MTKHTVTLKFSCPDTVSRPELRDFIHAALVSWGGAFHPADHLFGALNEVSLKFDGRAPPVPREKRKAYFRNLSAILGGGYS